MLRVHVLIDLDWQKAVGGHVKTWLQFAQVAAQQSSPTVDLTLHFLGDRSETITIAPAVRYVIHRPRFSTRRLPFLRDIPSDTDLASTNPALIPYLSQADIVHVTHPLFTFGTTARHYCQQTQTPLVCSLHTDAPLYTQLYLQEKLQKIFGSGWFYRQLIAPLHIPQRLRQSQMRQQLQFWASCVQVWTGQPSEQALLESVLPPERISQLRRGLEQTLFTPTQRDRAKVASQYEIPEDRLWLLFVGRVDACKNIETYTQAIRYLLDQGLPIQAVVVGKGSSREQVKVTLGDRVSLLGTLDQTQLSPVYASSDVFVFPSETEIVGNVVLEAMASGLPVLISDRGGVVQHLRSPGVDGWIIPGQDPQIWADKILQLCQDQQQREQMGQSAWHTIQQTRPSWETVYNEDLLPIWQRLGTPS